MKNSIVAFIPARAGSKGVPDKNIKDLGGDPVIAYSIRAALKSKMIDRVIVSTDSEEYAQIAKSYGAEVPFLRPAELAADGSTDKDVILHLLDWMKKNEGDVPEFLVHLRPTTPLREPTIVDAAIKEIQNNKEATALRSVHEMSQSAFKTMMIKENYLEPVGANGKNVDLDDFNLPRQSFSMTYDPNGYVDVLRVSFIESEKKIHGRKVIGFTTPFMIEVDSLDEFEFLEYSVSKSPEKKAILFND